MGDREGIRDRVAERLYRYYWNARTMDPPKEWADVSDPARDAYLRDAGDLLALLDTESESCEHEWEFVGVPVNSEGVDGVCRKCGARHYPESEPVAWRCQFDGGPSWFYFGTEGAVDQACEGEADAGACVIVKEPLYTHPVGRAPAEREEVGRWKHMAVWFKGAHWYIANLADGEDGIGPFDSEEDAKAALRGLRATPTETGGEADGS